MESLTTALAVQLPAGFRSHHIELSIKGLCPDCQTA
jgi:Fe2+ or Zn2+ uptake regulation protein